MGARKCCCATSTIPTTRCAIGCDKRLCEQRHHAKQSYNSYQFFPHGFPFSADESFFSLSPKYSTIHPTKHSKAPTTRIQTTHRGQLCLSACLIKNPIARPAESNFDDAAYNWQAPKQVTITNNHTATRFIRILLLFYPATGNSRHPLRQYIPSPLRNSELNRFCRSLLP